jgi:hypothetical protein
MGSSTEEAKGLLTKPMPVAPRIRTSLLQYFRSESTCVRLCESISYTLAPEVTILCPMELSIYTRMGSYVVPASSRVNTSKKVHIINGECTDDCFVSFIMASSPMTLLAREADDDSSHLSLMDGRV